MKIITKIIAIIILIVVLLTLCSNVLFLAEDESEGIPGVDMAALWNVQGGFQWIYPGSSTNANGETLHNIHMINENKPYSEAKNIIQHTYNTTPNICVVVNNNASEKIFGGDIISDIRQYDWGEGYSRGTAVEKSMQDYKINYLQIIPCILTGDIHIFLI